MIIDLHVHTNQASHSNLDPQELIQEAKRLGLDGVCVTEHDRAWDLYAARELAQEHQFLFLRGIEVSTDMGHVLVYGLHEYLTGIHKLENMRGIVRDLGGAMIMAHPYRTFTRQWGAAGDPGPEFFQEACRQPFLQYVDGLEVMNGATEEDDNRLALEVAGKSGLVAAGGSDAHSRLGLGCFVTIFDEDIKSEEDLIRELKAGRCKPGKMSLSEGASSSGENAPNPEFAPVI